MRPADGDGWPSGGSLLALWAAAVLLFNFPLLIVWDGGTIFGLPSLPVALFAIWAGLIAALAWACERGPAPPPADRIDPPEP
jgi:hypothetical protein